MTPEEVKKDTLKHIDQVKRHIHKLILELEYRADTHDASKLYEPEFSIFTKYTPILSDITYGSDKYHETLRYMKPALDHHYNQNRHHPEHFENGIEDMTLIDLIELICDWTASTLRHNNGNIYESLKHNKKRFNIPDSIYKVLVNTVNEHFKPIN